MAVDTLFLDAGGVLVFPNWNRISRVLADHGVIVAPETLAAAEPRAKHQLDTEDRTQLTDRNRGWLYFDLLLREAGVEVNDRTDAALADLHAYHSVSNLWEYVPPDVGPALDAFERLGLRLVVVSNSNGKLAELLDRLGLASRFAVVVDSTIEGVEKPDRRLFQIALERAGARVETTVHAGDLYYVDVVGARAAGLRAVLIDPADLYEDKDCARVRSLGVLASELEKNGSI